MNIKLSKILRHSQGNTMDYCLITVIYYYLYINDEFIFIKVPFLTVQVPILPLILKTSKSFFFIVAASQLQLTNAGCGTGCVVDKFDDSQNNVGLFQYIFFMVQGSPLILLSKYLTPFLRMQVQVSCMESWRLVQ